MTKYTFSEARQKLAAVLDRAAADGEVLITRKDGTMFVVKPARGVKSPLDVKGIDLGLSAAEIVSIVRETRER
jgi:prevent-host-death family protein